MKEIVEKRSIRKTISYIAANRIPRYITILLLLFFVLFALIKNIDSPMSNNAATVDDRDYYFYLLPAGAQYDPLETELVKEMAKVNNYRLVKVDPVSPRALEKLLKQIDGETDFKAEFFRNGLHSYYRKISQMVVADGKPFIPNYSNRSNDDKSKKDFLRWLKGVRKYHTKFARITPYDDLIRKYAKSYGLDWRLVASQMYFESHYKQYSKSFAGAMGLMQLAPDTVKDLGLSDAYHVEDNIASGIKYLESRLKIFKRSKGDERIRLALASYNAGLGHVLDAQRLAKSNGLDPTKWKDTGRMLLDLTGYTDDDKQITEYEETGDDLADGGSESLAVRHGYCRGTETVSYVDKIMKRYQAYKNLVWAD